MKLGFIIKMPGSKLRLVGGALLAICFVLPAVRACDSAVVPAKELVVRTPPQTSLLELATMLAMFVLPYLFGALVAASSALPRRARAIDRAVGALIAADVAVIAIWFGVQATENHRPLGDFAFAAVLALVFAYIVRTLLRAHGPIAVRFVAAVAATIWFAAWSVTPTALYGVYLSTLGSLAVAAGTSLQARALSTKRGLRLLWGLITAKLD